MRSSHRSAARAHRRKRHRGQGPAPRDAGYRGRARGGRRHQAGPCRRDTASVPVPRTIADGQALPTPGELTFSVNQRLLDGIVLVGDDEIRDAMRFAFERLKIVLEPSGATPLAALLAHVLAVSRTRSD
ncbi:hypothetical protein SHIRM173S_04250 [Streptomyces hirsutus]